LGECKYLNESQLIFGKESVMRQLPLVLTLLLGTSINAWAYEGKGSNPGDWKMMPASLETQNGKWHLRLRNLDLFPKYCSLRVTLKEDKLIQDEALLFKADRSLTRPLDVDADRSLSLDDLNSNLSCVKLADGETLEQLPDPGKLGCEMDREDCENICKADAENIDRCENQHLVLEFSRSSYKVEETTAALKAQARIKSNANETLTCQALMTARIVGGAEGDVSAVIAATESFVMEPAQKLEQQWTFDKSEAGVGRRFDISRPRIAVLCASGKVEKDSNWFKSCHPLKRSECNWLLVKD
jgi:hypothetical protein